MTLKHYGGSTPKGPTEWTCPSCGVENTVPLKAGCQSCGAGGDARKVGVPGTPERAAPETVALIAEEKREDAQRVADFHATQACRDWLAAHNIPDNPRVAVANSTVVQEAFMAGVAWAQAQQRAVVQVHSYGDTRRSAMTPNPVEVGTSPVTPPVETATLILSAPSTGEEPADDQTLQTILAALAFYRDNVLNYGAVPGQLDAQGVGELIGRLLPPEEDR